MKEWDMGKNLGWVTLGVSGLIIPLPMAMSGAITVNSWAQLVYVPILSALASVGWVLLFCAAWNGLARILDRRWLVLLYNDGHLAVGTPNMVPGLKISKKSHGFGKRWSRTTGYGNEVNYSDHHGNAVSGAH